MWDESGVEERNLAVAGKQRYSYPGRTGVKLWFQMVSCRPPQQSQQPAWPEPQAQAHCVPPSLTCRAGPCAAAAWPQGPCPAAAAGRPAAGPAPHPATAFSGASRRVRSQGGALLQGPGQKAAGAAARCVFQKEAGVHSWAVPGAAAEGWGSAPASAARAGFRRTCKPAVQQASGPPAISDAQQDGVPGKAALGVPLLTKGAPRAWQTGVWWEWSGVRVVGGGSLVGERGGGSEGRSTGGARYWRVGLLTLQLAGASQAPVLR